MSTPTRRETAKIYPFPHRARVAALEALRDHRGAPARLATVCDHAGAWYHEAAIQEDQRGRKP